MPSCEKCWNDSRGHHRSDAYSNLVAERDASKHVCTPEQQAGYGADECPVCKRKSIHIYCGVCMNYKCSAHLKGDNQ